MVRSIQEEILDILGEGETDAEQLVETLGERHPELLSFDIRSALLPLMSTGLVEWTKAGKFFSNR